MERGFPSPRAQRPTLRCSPGQTGLGPSRAPPPAPSVGLALRELLFDGLFSGLAVWEVEAKVGPLVRP